MQGDSMTDNDTPTRSVRLFKESNAVDKILSAGLCLDVVVGCV